MTRAIASVTVFKTQMKIFEQKIFNDKQYEDRLASTGDILGKANNLFSGDDQKVCPANSDSSKKSLSVAAAANMKKALTSNINRIDLLTDSKIGEVKSLMKELAD